MMMMITDKDDAVVKLFSYYFAFILQHYME